MSRTVFQALGLGLAITVAAPLAASAQAQPMPSRQDSQGQVTVTVTPTALSSDAWRFEVRFDTHVAPITQDLVAVSSLSDDKGHREQPLAWQGDPPGGHHRKGVLLFRPISPPPGVITLHIRRVGGIADRSFTWTLKG